MIVTATGSITVDGGGSHAGSTLIEIDANPVASTNSTLTNSGTINVTGADGIGILVRKPSSTLQNNAGATINITMTDNDPLRNLGTVINDGDILINATEAAGNPDGTNPGPHGVLVGTGATFTNNSYLSIIGGNAPNGSSIRVSGTLNNGTCALIEIDGLLRNAASSVGVQNDGLIESTFTGTNVNNGGPFINDGVLVDASGTHATSSAFFGGNDVDGASTGFYDSGDDLTQVNFDGNNTLNIVQFSGDPFDDFDTEEDDGEAASYLASEPAIGASGAGMAAEYQWSVPGALSFTEDGQTAPDGSRRLLRVEFPDNAGPGDATYTVFLTVTDASGCVATDEQTVAIHAPPQVPTLSEWGLFILALLLMSMGTLYLVNNKELAVKE